MTDFTLENTIWVAIGPKILNGDPPSEVAEVAAVACRQWLKDQRDDIATVCDYDYSLADYLLVLLGVEVPGLAAGRVGDHD